MQVPQKSVVDACRATSRHTRSALLTGIAALASILLADQLDAQTRAIPSTIDCATCSIVATRTTLVDTGSGALARDPRSVARDRQGRFIVVPSGQRTRPAVFGPSGDFIRWLGGSGQGPGEFTMPFAVSIDWTDSVHVFDMANARRTVFGPDLRYVSGRPSQLRINHQARDLLLLEDGRLVANASFMTTGRTGYPLHLLSSEGVPIRSFGVETPSYRPELRHLMDRVLANLRDGGILVAHSTSYRLERWDANGERTFEIIRNNDWFSANSRYGTVSPDVPPGSLVTGIREDEDGLIWTAVLVAAPGWARAVRPVVTASGSTVYEYTSVRQAFNTVIEVLDPKRNVVVARLMHDAPLVKRVDDRMSRGITMIAVNEITGMDVALEVWEFSLVRAR